MIGATDQLDEANKLSITQPKLLEPDNYDNFLKILSTAGFVLFLIFLGFWISSIKLQTLFSVYDIFTEQHLQRPEDPNENNNEDKSKYSYIGGFFTGTSIVVLVTIFIYYLYIFFGQNTKEVQELVPSNTLADRDGFDSKELTLTISFNSLRNPHEDKCPNMSISAKQPNSISINLIKSDIVLKSSCNYKLSIKKSDIFETGDYILFDFDKSCRDCYTSDISMTLEADAAYHNKKSRFSQAIQSDQGTVFRGKTPSVFYFGLIPAFYKDYTQSPQTTHYGYRITEIYNADYGSSCTPNYIYLNTGLYIEIFFTLSELGIYTSYVLKADALGFFSIMLGAMSGIVGLVSMIMIMYEFGYFGYKYKHIPKPAYFRDEYERRLKLRERKKIKKRNKKFRESLN